MWRKMVVVLCYYTKRWLFLGRLVASLVTLQYPVLSKEEDGVLVASCYF